jgi:hypothetical protein
MPDVTRDYYAEAAAILRAILEETAGRVNRKGRGKGGRGPLRRRETGSGTVFANYRVKPTGFAILISRASTSLQAAPAA